MESIQIFAFQSLHIIGWGESVVESLINTLNENQFQLQDGDIVSITSKVISMEEKARKKLSEINPSKKAEKLATVAQLDPRVVQLILEESNNEVFGAVYHAILTKTRFGLTANAGIDLSNCPEGYALLLPDDPDKSAKFIRKRLRDHLGVNCAVIVTDSRTIPLKRGTTGVALGVAGMDPIIDERGKEDLYGYKMTVTARAIADNTATVTNMLMGETSERRPFAVIRGLNYNSKENVTMESTMMSEHECLYFGPLLKLIDERE